ncbi:hypothetical protein [Methanolobus sp.]|jgi:hypothetical protein|uniref:hypothetical protein n=1 Tax=Methanolobus sp. TaxID=1874737 RepID=UPI0025E68A45|nr:hypothetical protein [Methanolobus sp.]
MVVIKKEDLNDSLKQFIESRIKDAIRIQVLYPDKHYIASCFVRKLDNEQMDALLNRSMYDTKIQLSKNDLKW